MNGTNSERWGAASGYLVILLGVAGAAFERGGVAANAPVEEAVIFFSKYRQELLAQSLMFVLSAGAYVWFYGSLRSFLLRTEGGSGRLATVVFGGGILSAAIQMVLQGFQVALAGMAGRGLDHALAGLGSSLGWALSVIGYVPVAVLLAAVAVLSLRAGALPRWLGWYSAFTALAHLVMSLGLVVESGPLVPGGGLTYALYALFLLWLVATTTVMVVRSGRPLPVAPAAGPGGASR